MPKFEEEFFVSKTERSQSYLWASLRKAVDHRDVACALYWVANIAINTERAHVDDSLDTIE